MMFQKKYRTVRFAKFAGALMLSLTMGGAAYAAKSLVYDRRINEQKLGELIEETNKKSTIKVLATPGVLDTLNKAAGTERGRYYMRATLKRMQKYEAMISENLAKKGLPLDLLAVPAMESGYQNVDNRISAGIWSFVPQTARNYDLRVDDTVDERFDEAKLTKAATEYFSALYGRFKDWHLALLAYNAGERTIEDARKQTKSSDAQTLIAKATNLSGENQRYLDQMMAFIILIKNPQLVN